MRWAVINNWLVDSIIESDEYPEVECQLIVDVTDSPSVSPGYVLNGNKLSVYDPVPSLQSYVQKDVKSFIDNMKSQLVAENMAQGITESGKTWDILSWYCLQITIPGKTRGISLKEALDEYSLDVALMIIEYRLLLNDYEDLSPFITSSRLQEWKNKILDFIL